LDPGETTKTWLHLPFESREGLQLRLHTRSRCSFHCLAGLRSEPLVEPEPEPSQTGLMYSSSIAEARGSRGRSWGCFFLFFVSFFLLFFSFSFLFLLLFCFLFLFINAFLFSFFSSCFSLFLSFYYSFPFLSFSISISFLFSFLFINTFLFFFFFLVFLFF
jgi:hypothetical protein